MKLSQFKKQDQNKHKLFLMLIENFDTKVVDLEILNKILIQQEKSHLKKNKNYKKN